MDGEGSLESRETKRWLDECRGHSLVQCTDYTIPTGILPPNYNGIITSVKVGGGKRSLSDDDIYYLHPDLRIKVGRGNCVLKLSLVSDKGKLVSTTYVFLTFAMRKFSGGMGDEDKSQRVHHDWIRYFIGPLPTVVRVVSTEKLNGDTGYVSSRTICNRSYFCIGSKNMHLFIRKSEDLNKYTGKRFEFARRVARTFFTTFVENSKIPEEKKDAFYNFMRTNKCTCVFELIQPERQHVVNLSHLKHPQLRFICWTIPDVEQSFNSTSLCYLPVHQGIEKANEFGLSTVDYEIIVSSPQENVESIIEDYMQKVRRSGTGTEGKVLYFMDNDQNTIGLIKKKTAWYVLLHAIREKLLRLDSVPQPELCRRIEERINGIQRLLQFSDGYGDAWKEIALGFANWLYELRVAKHWEQPSVLCLQFPTIFQRFLDEGKCEKFKTVLENMQDLF